MSPVLPMSHPVLRPNPVVDICVRKLESQCFGNLGENVNLSPYLRPESKARLTTQLVGDTETFSIADDLYLALHEDRFLIQNQSLGYERYRIAKVGLESVLRGDPLPMETTYTPPVARTRSREVLSPSAFSTDARVLRVTLPAEEWPEIRHDYPSLTAFPGGFPINTYSYYYQMHLLMLGQGIALFQKAEDGVSIVLHVLSLSAHQMLMQMAFPDLPVRMNFVPGELAQNEYDRLWEGGCRPTTLSARPTYLEDRQEEEHPLLVTDHDLLHGHMGLSDTTFSEASEA